MGIMLVYDITQEKSFENIKNWIRNIEENASADVEKMLLGNKCELNDKRQVTKERGEQLAVEYGIKFMETSAKSSINVEEAFFTLASDIKAKMEKRMVNPSRENKRYVIKQIISLFFCRKLIIRPKVVINCVHRNQREKQTVGCPGAAYFDLLLLCLSSVSSYLYIQHKHTHTHTNKQIQ